MRCMLAVFFLCAGMGSAAQSPESNAARPQFDVASVKPSNAQNGSFRQTVFPNGRFLAVNRSLISLIASAYGLRVEQVVNGPTWIQSERFDIEAKPAESDIRISRSQIQLMLQSLLAERFELVAHRENRGTTGLALVIVRKDQRLGSQIHLSERDCARSSKSKLPTEQRTSGRFDNTECGMFMSDGILTGVSQTLRELTLALAMRMNRSVVDRTGLDGRYEFTLNWRRDSALLAYSGSNVMRITSEVDQISVALQDQLGLKLEEEKSGADVLVIDHVERPSPD